MAVGSNIATFFATLGIRTDERGFARANSQLRNVTSAVKGFLAAAGVMAAGRAMASAIDEITEMGDRVSKLSTALGISEDALQTFEFAADRSGVSVDALRNALGRLPKGIADAAQGSMQAKRALDAMGLSATELFKLNPEDQFLAVADAVKNIENPTKRTVAVMDIFGRSGAALIPLLDEGREGIEALGNELTAYGGKLSGPVIESSVAWRDTLADLTAITRGLKTQIVVGLLPPLQWIASQFKKLAKQGKLQKAMEITKSVIVALGLAAAVAGGVLGIGLLNKNMLMLGLRLGVVVAVGAALVFIFDELYNTLSGNNSLFSKFLNWLDKTEEKGPGIDLLRKIFGGLGEDVADVVFYIKEAWERLTAFLDSTEKLEYFIGLWDKFVSFFTTPIGAFFDSIVNGIRNTVRELNAFLESGPAKQLATLAKVPGKLADAGGKVIDFLSGKPKQNPFGNDPIVNGIKSLGSNIGGAFGAVSDVGRIIGTPRIQKEFNATSASSKSRSIGAMFGDVNVVVNGANQEQATSILTNGLTKAARQIQAQGTPAR